MGKKEGQRIGAELNISQLLHSKEYSNPDLSDTKAYAFSLQVYLHDTVGFSKNRILILLQYNFQSKSHRW